MQSKRKFISTVSTVPEALTETEKAVIRAAILKLDQELDPSIFTGLDTKARVTLNANACWEKTQQDGGTLESIAEIVTTGQSGEPAYIRDLFSGEITESVLLTEVSVGTYIFWRCLDVVLKSDPKNIRQAALVMISEPGKARTVTKASAALKIVLDVVNKICSYPLGKIKSSASGMHKASHAWNSFKAGFTDEGKDFVFAKQKCTTKLRPDGTRIVENTYRDLWMSSTDYSEATDKLRHEVARPIAEYWMKKCGIPPILQAIVKGTCFVPRPIVFEAYGPMSSFGFEWKGDSPFREPRFVMLQRGVLMGDPLTKVCLHLVNILVRVIGENYSSEAFIRNIFPFESPEVSAYLKKYTEDPVPPSFSVEREEEYTPQGAGSSVGSTVANDLSNASVILEIKEERSTKKESPPATPIRSAKPLNYILKDTWIRKPICIDAQLEEGKSLQVNVKIPEVNLPKDPLMARKLTFRSAEMRNVVIAHQEMANSRLTILREQARALAIQEGFQWDPLKDVAVGPRHGARSEAVATYTAAYSIARAARIIPATHDEEIQHCLCCIS
jgi:hypothetical protein